MGSKSKKTKSSSNRFWDDDKMRYAAHYYMDKHGLDKTNMEVKEAVRAMLRIKRENLKKSDPSKTKTKTKAPKSKKRGKSRISREIKRFEETKDLDSLNILESKAFVKEILQDGLDNALKSGPLPPPTGYDSRDGTWWDDPTDINRRKRINYFTDKDGKKKKLPSFGKDDIAWIEFFLGNTLLKPKNQEDIKKLQRENKLGKTFPIQKEMSTFLDDNPWAKFEVWRGAGKTVVVMGKLLRKICDNPNECFFFQSETDDKTIQRIGVIKKELQTNQRIISFYGYLPSDAASTGKKDDQMLGRRHPGKWQAGVITLKRDITAIEPTLMGISWNTGRGVGYHYTGGVLDDPWSGHNQAREKDFDKFWRWWGEFYGSLEYARFCWVLCTKKDEQDIYQKMDDDELFAQFRRKLVLEFPQNYEFIKKNGAVVDVTIINKNPKIQYVYDNCFEKYTIEKALIIRNRIGEQMFEREYQNNPQQLEGKLFNWNNIQLCYKDSADRYARFPLNPEQSRRMNGLIFYDPAFGVTSEASLNALVAMASYENRIYILRIWAGHWVKDERIRAFNHAKRMFPNYPFYCEDVMHQINMIRDLTDSTGIHLRAFSPKEKGIRYKQLFNGQSNPAKKAKIYDSLEPIIEDRRLYLMKSTPYFDEFEREIKNFPDGNKMDVIDATSMGAYILDRRGRNVEVLDSKTYTPKGRLPNNLTIGKTFRLRNR